MFYTYFPFCSLSLSLFKVRSTLRVVKTKVLITAHDTTINTLVKMWYFQGKEGKKKNLVHASIKIKSFKR